MRDEFTEHTKRGLAHRAGYRCSNPDCAAWTIGPGSDPESVVKIGVAAHITGASPGGPRYDPTLTSEERRASANGIWLCHNCGKVVDSDVTKHDVRTLQRWKRLAEANARVRLGRVTVGIQPYQPPLSDEEAQILVAASISGEIAVFSSDQSGKFVRAGKRDFWDERDAAVGEVYLEALQSLITRGLVRHDGGIRYTLTGSGFKVGRAIASPDHQ
jgi:hypothetical protein